MAVIAPLIATLMQDVAQVDAVHTIIPYIPKFAAHVNTLAIPGGEKKRVVITGLHTFADELLKAGKVTAELKQELDAFIDLVVPVTIDTIIQAARGSFDLKKVAGGCLVAWMSLLCRRVAATAPVPVPAPLVKVADVLVSVTEAPEAPETPASEPAKDVTPTTE
jgi:hypothetical protein